MRIVNWLAPKKGLSISHAALHLVDSWHGASRLMPLNRRERR
jgi:hypothetical protein